MKLRLRSIETKETLRLEIPNLSSIDHLKQTLAQSISAAPAALRLSLNRRDELLATPGRDSLQSLGVTSGDLVFYTLDPSSQTLARPPPPISHSSVAGSPIPISTAATAVGPQVPILGNSETVIGESAARDYDSIGEERRPVGSNSETLDASSTERMEIDDGPDEIGLEKYSEAFFLNRVLNEELGEEDTSNRKLLIVSVHAAVLDSGFIRFDSVSGLQVNRFPREDECPRASISISYTLPEIMKNSCNNGCRVEGVVLKFQLLGRFVNVYGSLVNGGSGPYLVRLDENIYAPVIKSVFKNRNVERRELMEFWKIVKDGITLPLLIDLSEKAGLPAPPNLMRLPPELKMKILEPLPGVALTKAGAVCKELRNLSNNDELWKQKYVEEFGGGSEGEGTVVNWKGKFGRNWEAREQQRKALTYRPCYPRRDNPRFGRREPPHPMFAPPFPGMIGGDYDRFPLFGVGDPTGPPHSLARPRINGRLPGGRRPSFAPDCDLGGFRG